jgi:dCMP deaminase
VRKPSWSDYYLGIAEAASRRSSCERAKVGAVVVTSSNRVASLGYNDSPAGRPGCGSCPRRLSGVAHGSGYDSGPGVCVALHAEANALLFASRRDCEGGTLYVTREPCSGCLRLIEGSGLARVVWPGGHLSTAANG